MCGILGVRRSWCADRPRIAAAFEALRWRGPDSQELIELGGWYLGVARLAITDPDADQPIVDGHGRAVLLNGAVTSAAGERSRYAGRLRSGNDAELLLARLQERGPESLLDMSGPYAFAIVDAEKDEVFLGRDPEGEKPLFVVVSQGRIVAFASTLASLRQLGIRTELSAAERARFFRYGHHRQSESSDPALQLLEPWHGLLHQQGDGPWEPMQVCDPVDLPGGTLSERLDAAVARCASAEVGLGLCLSGGIDSACIAVGLQRAGHSLPAYQFRALGEPEEERQSAAVVADRCGHELRRVDAGPEILRFLPELSALLGAPLGDPSVLAAHAIARSAAADSVRVLLSGEGADDLLLGYRRHRAAAYLPSRGWTWLPRPEKSMGTLARSIRALAATDPFESLLEVVPPIFQKRLWPDGDSGVRLRVEPSPSAGRSSLEKARELDHHYYLREDLLPKLDTAMMAAGVEGRCPFLDPAVLASEEVSELPAEEILGKRPLRQAYAAALPAGIMDQRKRGLSLPLDRWFREDDFLPALLREERCLSRGIWHGPGMLELLEAHQRGKLNIGRGLYLLAAFEVYLRAEEESE
ncbi:MAG: asparagine synthetase B family protein [Planctomycetota bacterium]|jgi:asparagine synthase (glutamine-hydrolysing)